MTRAAMNDIPISITELFPNGDWIGLLNANDGAAVTFDMNRLISWKLYPASMDVLVLHMEAGHVITVRGPEELLQELNLTLVKFTQRDHAL